MGTLVADLIPMLDREINAPGVELFTTIGGGAKLGYIQDAFWDARLTGMLGAYTIADGADLDPVGVTGKSYFTDMSTKSKSLDTEFWMLIVLFAGFRLIRLKIMNLAVNFTAEAGPVKYEQQASATTLRALLASLTARINELKEQYSDDFAVGYFRAIDGMAQAEYAALNDLASQTIVY